MDFVARSVKQGKSKHQIIEDTIHVKEKGYVDNPDDSGGATNWGITVGTAKAHDHMWADYGWDGDMFTMPIDFAYAVYSASYWDKQKLDLIHARSPELAEKMFEIGVNYSTREAQRWLQRLLNIFNNKGTYYADIVADGYVGPATCKALDAYIKRRGEEGIAVMYVGLNTLLGNHYITLSEKREKDETFSYGWLRARVEDSYEEFYS